MSAAPPILPAPGPAACAGGDPVSRRDDGPPADAGRRGFPRTAAAGAALAALSACDLVLENLLRKHFRELSPGELDEVLAKLERRNQERFGRKTSVSAAPARAGVEFGYGLDLSRCLGCRRCVYACVKENNQSRKGPQIGARHFNWGAPTLAAEELNPDQHCLGMAARPYWNASILAPRFLASAFCSGPAMMIVLFQILRRTFRLQIQDEAIWKIAELMAYAMFVNQFLLGAELFKEYYSATEHLAFTRYLWNGLEGHTTLVKFAWVSLACSLTAFVLFLVPRTRRRYLTLNLGCVLICVGVYIEKGTGLVIPGFTPSTLGQIYEYTPAVTEWAVAAGIFGVGFLVFTVLGKVAVPILMGTFRAEALQSPTPVATPRPGMTVE